MGDKVTLETKKTTIRRRGLPDDVMCKALEILESNNGLSVDEAIEEAIDIIKNLKEIENKSKQQVKIKPKIQKQQNRSNGFGGRC